MDLTRLIAETPDGVLGVAEDGRVVYANHAAERLLKRPGGLIGEPFDALVQGGGELLASARRKPGTAHAILVRGDGLRLPVEAAIAVHHEGRGGRGAFHSVILHDQPPVPRGDLARLLAAEKEAFLAAAAHELRAPIQPILTSLRTLERAAASGISAPPDTLPRALRQANRLSRLVTTTLRDLAAADRKGAGPDVEVVHFDLATLVSEVVDDFRQSAPDRAITYAGVVSGLTLWSDRDRVNRILQTLLENALKYSPRDQEVAVELGASATEARLQVTDRGIGIPAEEQASIFDKFYRGSNIAADTQGLGMGLYLARRLATRLRGKLSVTSKEGEGSTFSLVLPRTWPAPEISPPPPLGA